MLAALVLAAGGSLAVFRPARTEQRQASRATESTPAFMIAPGASVTPGAPSQLAEPSLPSASSLPDAPSATSSARALRSPSVARSPLPPSEAKLDTVVLADGPRRDPGMLGDAMRGAVDAMRGAVDASRSSDPPPAELHPASVAHQLRPSPGAVVGAINGVLPAARACLGPDDPVTAGTMVFRSDGSIAHVDLVGGRPTDECIRTALTRARVEPFFDDSFATRVTVRPWSREVER